MVTVEPYLLAVIVILACMDSWLGVIWLLIIWYLSRTLVGPI